MANPHYARSANFKSSTTARGSEVKAEFDLVVAGFDSLDEDITKLEGDISNLQAGDPPGWGASIDTRWFVTDTSASSSAYTATLSPAPTGENVQEGYSIDFLANNANTGAATLDIDSLDGQIPIVKVNGPAYQALDPDDIGTLDSVKLTFISGNWVLRRSGGSDVEIGTITPFGGSVIPDDYLECNGAAVSRITYADLFGVIGVAYGVGDGVNTFNVPDLRGRPFIGNDDDIGGEGAAGVLLPLKAGYLAGGEPSGKSPAYGTWIVKV